MKQHDQAIAEYQKQEAQAALEMEARKAEEVRLHEMALAEEQLTQAAIKRDLARKERAAQLQEQLDIMRMDVCLYSHVVKELTRNQDEHMSKEQQKQLDAHERQVQLLKDMEEQLAVKQRMLQQTKEIEELEDEK